MCKSGRRALGFIDGSGSNRVEFEEKQVSCNVWTVIDFRFGGINFKFRMLELRFRGRRIVRERRSWRSRRR